MAERRGLMVNNKRGKQKERLVVKGRKEPN
jgi:hypothetical protein